MYLVTLVFGGFLIAHGRMEASDLAMYAPVSYTHLDVYKRQSQYSVSAGAVWTGVYGNSSNACT